VAIQDLLTFTIKWKHITKKMYQNTIFCLFEYILTFPKGGYMKKVVNRQIIDDVFTTVSSPKGVTTYWTEKLNYEDGTSDVLSRKETTFGFHSIKGHFMLLDCGKRH
jgi:hypothetical protein